MKKHLIISSLFSFFTFLFTFNTVNAQVFRAGFSAGATATDIDGMDLRDRDNDFNKLGYIFGAIVNTSPGKKNTFQMELNYVQKGTLQRPDSMNQGYYKLAIDYVDMAFLLRHNIHFNIKQKPVDKFDWELGASLGRMVRHTWNLDNYPSPLNLSNMNQTDVSLFGGIDYNFSSKACFCIRYSNSVVPVIKHAVIPSYLYGRLFNSGNNMAFQMSIKFIFGGSGSEE